MVTQNQQSLDAPQVNRPPVFQPPFGTPTPFYVVSPDGSKKFFDPVKEVEKEATKRKKRFGLLDRYLRYEGDSGETYTNSQNKEKKIREYSIYQTIRGYLRGVGLVKPTEANKLEFSNISFLLQDPGDKEYFELKGLANSGFSDSILIALQDKRVDWSQPLVFSAYVKAGKDGRNNPRGYMQYSVTQDHMPGRADFPDLKENFYVKCWNDFPVTEDSRGKKSKDWGTKHWENLLPDLPADIRSMPIRDGLVEAIHRNCVRVFGEPPTEAELIAMLNPANPDTGSFSSYDEDDDDWGAMDSSAPAAPKMAAPMSFGATSAPTSTAVESEPAPVGLDGLVNSLGGQVTQGLPMPAQYDTDQTKKIPAFVSKCVDKQIDLDGFCAVFNQPSADALVDAGLADVANDHLEALTLINARDISGLNKVQQQWAEKFKAGIRAYPPSFTVMKPAKLKSVLEALRACPEKVADFDDIPF